MLFDKLRKRMKGVIIVVAAAFIVTLLYVGGGSFFQSVPEAEAVAEVNGSKIGLFELQQAYNNTVGFYLQFGQSISRLQEQELRYATLQQLIDQELMLQAARKERVKVDNADVNRQFDAIRTSIEAQGGNFRQELRFAGFTERSFRDLIREGLMIDAIREAKRTAVVSDEEVRQAYEEGLERREVRHILIAPGPGADEAAWEEARVQAEALLERLRAGEEFGALAEEHSDDPGSAANGGGLGEIRRTDPYVEEFLAAAFSLAEGEISEPVRSPFGYHLIQVTRVEKDEGEPFEEVADGIRRDLELEKGSAQFEAWLAGLRAEAAVTVFDPELRARQLVEIGRLDQAIAQYQEAIALRPHDPYLHYHLADTLERVGARDEALEAYREAAEKGGSDPELWFTLGLAYRDRGMNEEAKEAFVAASESAPASAAVHRVLAGIFTELGDPDLAAEEVAKAEEIERLIAEQQAALAEARREQEDLQRQLEEALRRDNEESD